MISLSCFSGTRRNAFCITSDDLFTDCDVAERILASLRFLRVEFFQVLAGINLGSGLRLALEPIQLPHRRSRRHWSTSADLRQEY